MSSLVRRIELRILREKKLIPQRHKAINKKKGQPYRNGYFKKIEGQEEPVFIRFH